MMRFKRVTAILMSFLLLICMLTVPVDASSSKYTTKEFQDYMNSLFQTLSSDYGKVTLTCRETDLSTDSFDIRIKIDMLYDWADILKYAHSDMYRSITAEEKDAFINKYVQIQYLIWYFAEKYLPNKRILCSYNYGYYKYPTIKRDWIELDAFSWINYTPAYGIDAYKKSKYTGKMTFMPNYDDYKFDIKESIIKSAKKTVTSIINRIENLPAPDNIYYTVKNNSVKLKWDVVEKANGYRVYMYNNKTKKYETYKSVTTTYCNINELNNNTTYKFKIAALIKKNGKYIVQNLSEVVTVKMSSKSSTSTSGASLMSFPSFGTSKSSAVKAMGLTGGADLGEMQAGVYAYGGYKKVNGTDCMVILYFNSSQKFFYGAAFIPTEAITFKKALSSLRSAYGDETVKLNSSGIEMYEWVDETAMTAEFIGGKSGGEMTLYGKISSKYAPAGMSNSSDPMSSLGDIGSIL